MSAIRLSPRDRRALKALAGALTLATMWLGHRSLGQSAVSPAVIESLEQQYFLERERAERRPAQEERAKRALRSARSLERRLLEGDSPSLAQAGLRSLATGLLADEGIESPRSAFAPVLESDGPYLSVPLELEFSCDAAQLGRFLDALVAAGPILATRRIELRRAGSETARIHARLTIEGYLRQAEDRSTTEPGAGR